jgi:carbon-monoxide dehydrogenase medium subunit
VTPFHYLRPQSLPDALALLRQHGSDARPLAGGQSLLAAMKLGLSSPTHLVDLQDIPALREIRLKNDHLRIGALATHADVAASPLVQGFCPMLAALAGGIADQQVREAGTLGGALAHNDPAACWPAGVLALGATLCTDRREIAADAFFQGMYQTALAPGELLTAVHFPRTLQAAYHKQEQPASRFALVGVAVARSTDGSVRVALTGLGNGVVRHPAAEQALQRRWHADALANVALAEEAAQGDLHASAAYRAHLAGVWCRRLVQRMVEQAPPSTGEPEDTGGQALPGSGAATSLPHAQPSAPPANSGWRGWLRRLTGG